MTVVKVTITKPFDHAYCGIEFSRRNATSPLTIQSIADRGLFSSSPLVPGLIVLEINNESVTWLSPAEASRKLFSLEKGGISIAAEGFVAKVYKETAHEKLGISLRESGTPADDRIFLSRIKEQSKFYGSDIEAGMQIISINGSPCPKSAIKAIRMMQDTVGILKIVAIDSYIDEPIWAGLLGPSPWLNEYYYGNSNNEEWQQLKVHENVRVMNNPAYRNDESDQVPRAQQANLQKMEKKSAKKRNRFSKFFKRGPRASISKNRFFDDETTATANSTETIEELQQIISFQDRLGIVEIDSESSQPVNPLALVDKNLRERQRKGGIIEGVVLEAAEAVALAIDTTLKTEKAFLAVDNMFHFVEEDSSVITYGTSSECSSSDESTPDKFDKSVPPVKTIELWP